MPCATWPIVPILIVAYFEITSGKEIVILLKSMFSKSDKGFSGFLYIINFPYFLSYYYFSNEIYELGFWLI